MKYIILHEPDIGTYHPVLFDDLIVHKFAAYAAQRSNPKLEILGAGFVSVRNGELFVHGSSESLNIGPSDQDRGILLMFLWYGISGMELTNVLMLSANSNMSIDSILVNSGRKKKAEF